MQVDIEDSILESRIYKVEINRKPTVNEILQEWFSSLNFLHERKRLLSVLWLAFHICTGICLIFYTTFYISVSSASYLFGSVIFLGTAYNTIWYHRYCAHKAFDFTNKWLPRLLLWSNPSVLR